MSKYWFFENVNLFNLLCPHKLKQFAEGHKFIEYQKGEFIYLQGDTAKTIYLVNSGKIKMGYYDENDDEFVISYLGKGDIFGENALLDENKRKEFAQVMQNNTSLCSVTLPQMEELLRSNDAFNTGIYKFIGFKLKKIERRYKIMLFRDTKKRILEFLKELKDDDDAKTTLVNGEVLINNPFSQSEIAKLIGTSRSTFNLLLKELEQDHFFSWQKKKILLQNRFLSDI